MPLVAQIGDAVQTSGEATVEWNIHDFFTLSKKADDFYTSPVFSFADALCYLSLYPNGKSKNSSKRFVSLYLTKKDSGQPRTIKYTFGIKFSDGTERKEEIQHEFSAKNVRWGYPEFWSRSKLLNQASRLMPNNVLVITCHLKCYDLIATKVSLSNSIYEVSRHMKTILERGKRADFTLKLGDREWPVHKLILESRCEYFENMFRHDWIENTEKEVKFNDIEEDALDSVLQFIYTGAVEGMSVKNVCEIYVAAHKFLLDDLKADCIEYMKRNMCATIICKILVMADTYEMDDLNERAIEYWIQKTNSVFKSKGWKELENNNWFTVVELLREIFKRLKRLQKRIEELEEKLQKLEEVMECP